MRRFEKYYEIADISSMMSEPRDSRLFQWLLDSTDLRSFLKISFKDIELQYVKIPPIFLSLPTTFPVKSSVVPCKIKLDLLDFYENFFQKELPGE